ncbi:Alpha,alpha-trehalose-phosphate synthase [UDP-forming] 1 [Platanthera guangdongensis]|uniref:Alpha,alpha-trehalose-phosphate synthase [UDP-forming] 1 n=1 Tax=Platanthera guangdongensis TaxID=2320717 RepID=A0ABR2N2B5_9ASPA
MQFTSSLGLRTIIWCTSLSFWQRCIPVFLDEEIVHQYYNGYCNNILWPLFHYLGLPQEDRLATTRSFQSQFDAYKRANQIFADVVNQHYEEGDVVWCHDYHLMYLPKCLKEYNSKMKVESIGFAVIPSDACTVCVCGSCSQFHWYITLTPSSRATNYGDGVAGEFTEGRMLGVASVGASVPDGWSRGMKDLALCEMRRRLGHGCQIE